MPSTPRGGGVHGYHAKNSSTLQQNNPRAGEASPSQMGKFRMRDGDVPADGRGIPITSMPEYPGHLGTGNRLTPDCVVSGVPMVVMPCPCLVNSEETLWNVQHDKWKPW